MMMLVAASSADGDVAAGWAPPSALLCWVIVLLLPVANAVARAAGESVESDCGSSDGTSGTGGIIGGVLAP